MTKICLTCYKVIHSIERHDKSWMLLITTVTMLVALFLYLTTKGQVTIAQNQLAWQKHVDSLRAISDSINSHRERIKDSMTIAVAESSLALTRESNRRAEIAIQPFLSVDTTTQIGNLTVGKQPVMFLGIINVGATPAYNVVPMRGFIFQSDLSKVERKGTSFAFDTTGWFIGSKQKLWPLPVRFYNGDSLWTANDSISFFVRKHPLLLLSTIVFRDAFGRHHFTQQGYIFTSADPAWAELSSYSKTDHDIKQ